MSTVKKIFKNQDKKCTATGLHIVMYIQIHTQEGQNPLNIKH